MYWSDALRAQRMMQVGQPLEHPRLAAAIRRIAQAGEERVACRLVGRERRPHERESCLTIRILNPPELLVENCLPPRHGPDGQLLCELDVVRLGKRRVQAPSPSCARRARASRASRACVPCRARPRTTPTSAVDVVAWSRPSRSTRSRRGVSASRSGFDTNRQKPCCAYPSIRCRFSSSRSCGMAAISPSTTSAAGARPSSMSSQSVTIALPRVERIWNVAR